MSKAEHNSWWLNLNSLDSSLFPEFSTKKIFQLKNQQVNAQSLFALSFHWTTKLNYEELKEALPEIILHKGEIESLNKGFKKMKTKIKFKNTPTTCRSDPSRALYSLFKANKGTSYDRFWSIRTSHDALETTAVYVQKGSSQFCSSLKGESVVWDLVSTWFTITS